MQNFIKANWPAPLNIHAYATTRQGGFSAGPFESLNLVDYTGDNPETVAANRKKLIESLQLPEKILWLNQTHSKKIICLDSTLESNNADGAFSTKTNKVCVVTTADCLPILICNAKGTVVAALHAGWRGLALGIITEAMKQLFQYDNDWLIWFGPAIGAKVYEVGSDVLNVFLKIDPKNQEAFVPFSKEKWLMDVFKIARIEFEKLGIHKIYGGDYCTYSNKDLFYSYRRDGKTGRIANLIWMD